MQFEKRENFEKRAALNATLEKNSLTIILPCEYF